MSESNSKIQRLVESIFERHKADIQEKLRPELEVLVGNFNQRGILMSGGFAAAVGNKVGNAFRAPIDATIDEIDKIRKEARRRDGAIVWPVVEEKLKELSQREQTSGNGYAISFVESKTGNRGAYASAANMGFCQIMDHWQWRLRSRMLELINRDEFLALKTPADRKSEGIPDVAVMMWFPNEETESAAFLAAVERYEIIKRAVEKATSGMATVNKFDDPKLFVQDRISASIEKWLQKALLVVCDLEGNRKNFFYEFGFARGHGTDVMAIRKKGSETHFHLAQWPLTEYNDLKDLEEKLVLKLTSCLENQELSNS